MSIRLAEPFDRPLRLTPTQALALIAAGHHVRQVPGADETDPLQRALSKLARALDVDPDQDHIDLGESDDAVRAALLDAIERGRQIEIDYYSFGRDDRARRAVDPYRMVADQGRLYLLGWCHRSDDVRFFRVDRILALDVLDTQAPPPPRDLEWDRFQPGADMPRVTVDLDPAVGWVAEAYPCDEVVEGPNGTVRATLGIAARPWLERLLLTLGPAATVVEAPEHLASAGADAARRVLARYGEV